MSTDKKFKSSRSKLKALNKFINNEHKSETSPKQLISIDKMLIEFIYERYKQLKLTENKYKHLNELLDLINCISHF